MCHKEVLEGKQSIWIINFKDVLWRIVKPCKDAILKVPLSRDACILKCLDGSKCNFQIVHMWDNQDSSLDRDCALEDQGEVGESNLTHLSLSIAAMVRAVDPRVIGHQPDYGV